MTQTHTAIATTAKGVVDAIPHSTSTPAREEVLIKVEYASLMAFDTYVADLGFGVQEYPSVLGFNASGTIVQVGEAVDGLIIGDKVIAFGSQDAKTRTMQEYVVIPYTFVTKVPSSMSLDAAATIPDNFITAFFTLFKNLPLPVPNSFSSGATPEQPDLPILIYGAGATSGQYAIQILRAAGYKKILATASPRNHAFIRELGATDVFDYNSTDLAEDIAKSVGGDGKVRLVLDCVSAEETIRTVSKVLSNEGTVALLLPVKEGTSLRAPEGASMYMDFSQERTPLPEGAKAVGVKTFMYHTDEFLRLNLMPKILPQLLDAGIIQPNRVRLMAEGTFLQRVQAGLELLRDNQISGEKVIVQIP